VGYMQTAVAALTDALANTPDKVVNSVSILPGAERHQLLVEWNDTAADYPKDKCIHELFEAQVKNNPEAVAVIFEDEELTYGALNQRANQLAHYLINEKAVVPDTLVGICVERSLEMVIGILAILKAGGAYVPLDPEYPEARLQYMLDDANLTTVLTQRHLRETTPVSDEQAVCLDDEAVQETLKAQSTKNPNTQELGLTSSHLAYVIYTSGTTGKPKGVECHSKGVLSLLNTFERVAPVSKGGRYLCCVNLSFDVSAYEVIDSIVSGGTLYIVSNDMRMNSFALFDYIKRYRISNIYIPPFFINDFLSWLNEIEDKPVIKRMLVGVEPILLNILSQINSLIPELTIINGYGPTEAIICSSLYKVSSEKHNDKDITPIGRPTNNNQAYVLDAYEKLTPLGMSGELHIGGVGLARGYLNRPDLTAEKFIANPFYDNENPSSSDRLYKTGDLVRWLADGNLEFLGRIDHQVKIRGFRIELGEIENTLSTHVDVDDVVVVANESEAGDDKCLVAYMVTDAVDLQDNGKVPVASRHDLIERLRDHVSRTLPHYMVPSAFVLLNALPLTPNGKVDRKALPDADLSAQQNIYVAPRTQAEQTLCEVWQEVLGVERVGITDNFFQLGGHSLVAMRLLLEIQKKFNTEMSLQDVFTLQTVFKISEYIEGQLMLDSGLSVDGQDNTNLEDNAWKI
jgi:amino acid adenylation domain-containing protein